MKPYNTDQTKKEEVREMFDNIAPRYDLLNHTLSVNIDRIWRRRAVNEVRRANPRRILDVATGTGDLAIALARRIRDVQVMGVDLSEEMLALARRKVEARGLDSRIVLERGDAEHLEVADASVDAATVAFGVRNFGDLAAGLRELARTIKPLMRAEKQELPKVEIVECDLKEPVPLAEKSSLGAKLAAGKFVTSVEITRRIRPLPRQAAAA